jgi:hypothetical protein
VIVLRFKPVEEMCHSPTGTRTHVHISVALVAQYLNVRQLKLGTIIIQTVHVSYGMIVRTQVHCKWKDFVEHNPSYFQIIQSTL